MAILIACSMLKKEINSLIGQSGLEIQTVWMEKGLHEYPDKLREGLQREIDRCGEEETVLLAYGLCGNAVLGLKSGDKTLVIPRYDDCVRMLLSKPEREEIVVNPRCLYYTDAWIDSEKYLFRTFDAYLQKYGDRKGTRLAKKMIENYEEICLIDTGAYYPERCRADLKVQAGRWGLDYAERRGSLHVLKKLLLGAWDADFCRIGPDRTVEYHDFEGRARCVGPE